MVSNGVSWQTKELLSSPTRALATTFTCHSCRPQIWSNKGFPGDIPDLAIVPGRAGFSKWWRCWWCHANQFPARPRWFCSSSRKVLGRWVQVGAIADGEGHRELDSRLHLWNQRWWWRENVSMWQVWSVEAHKMLRDRWSWWGSGEVCLWIMFKHVQARR